MIVTLIDAINKALHFALQQDDKIIVFGTVRNTIGKITFLIGTN